MDKERFVQNIKNYCKLKGEKPTPACQKSGVGKSFINDIERGKMPSVENVQKLAQYLGVTVSELIGEDSPPFRALDNPIVLELLMIMENTSEEKQQQILDIAKIVKNTGYHEEKKSSPADGEAAEAEKEPELFESNDMPGAGYYRCAECGKYTAYLADDKTRLEVCPHCGYNYFVRIQINP